MVATMKCDFGVCKYIFISPKLSLCNLSLFMASGSQQWQCWESIEASCRCCYSRITALLRHLHRSKSVFWGPVMLLDYIPLEVTNIIHFHMLLEEALQ